MKADQPQHAPGWNEFGHHLNPSARRRNTDYGHRVVGSVLNFDGDLGRLPHGECVPQWAGTCKLAVVSDATSHNRYA